MEPFPAPGGRSPMLHRRTHVQLMPAPLTKPRRVGTLPPRQPQAAAHLSSPARPLRLSGVCPVTPGLALPFCQQEHRANK